MTPFDYANQIAELDPQKESYRQDVEKILNKFASEVVFECSARVHNEALQGRINYAHQAERVLRDLGYEYLDRT